MRAATQLACCIAITSAAGAGCDDRSCLGDAPDCVMQSPCARLAFACPGGDALVLRVLGDEPSPVGGRHARGARGDVLLGNNQVLAVIAGLGDQNYLDPNGGSLLDLGNPGAHNDGLNQLLQVVGVLPEDSVQYTSLRLVDERPARVAVQLAGTLLHRSNVAVHTLYEVRPCEPGVRVRTEVENGTPDPQQWTLSDVYYWGSGDELPFTPTEGGGFDYPDISIDTIDSAFRSFPFVATSTHAAPPASYAGIACDTKLMDGFQSEVLSAAGQARKVVPPRDYETFDRYLVVVPRGDVAAAADVALDLHGQLYAERLVHLAGVVDRGGLPLGSEREASILVSAGTEDTPVAERIPWTQVVPDAAGRFSVRVPAGLDYLLEVSSFGRTVLTRTAHAADADVDLGTLAIPAAATLAVTVTDGDSGAPIDAEVFLVPEDGATRADTTGTFHGRYATCAPWLGAPPGGSPACNRFLVSHAAPALPVEAPPGRYLAYAFHGPFWTISEQAIALEPGPTTSLAFTLRAVPMLLPPGTLGADLHVHGSASFDSALPDPDRVLSFGAAAIDVIVATDHDVVYDYSALLEQLGLADRMSAVSGVETTGDIPFLKVPGSDVPRTIGHYNFWPLAFCPGLPRNGAPQDEFLEPGALFDRVEPLFTNVGVTELNHPFAGALFGRDFGFPHAIGLDCLRDLPAGDDGTANGLFVRAPDPGGRRNDAHDAQEVMNGTRNGNYLPYRAFWFYMLNEGRLVTGTANSDSHGLADSTVGSPRNVIYAGTRAGPGFDVGRMNRAIRAGSLFGTNGPVIVATVDAADGEQAPYGMRLVRPAPGGKLHVEVSAAPWVPVEEVRIVVNGRVARFLRGADLMRPIDPFGTDGIARYIGDLPLADLLPKTGDAWIVVEAGWPLPLAGDLSGPNGVPDGIPDTSDNNGDGKVDLADVAPGATSGPLDDPPAPTDPSDPRFHFAQVVPGGYPAAFTNPFVLDVDGDGRFTAPGVAAGAHGTAP